MARLLGKMHPDWCPYCRTEPGPDCPVTGSDTRTARRQENRSWLNQEQVAWGDWDYDDADDWYEERGWTSIWPYPYTGDDQHCAVCEDQSTCHHW